MTASEGSVPVPSCARNCAGAIGTNGQLTAASTNALSKYAAMGKPLAPTPVQVDQLNRETALPAAEHTHLTDGKLEHALEPNALVLVKVDR